MKHIVLAVCLFLFICPSVYGLTVTGDVVIDFDMGDEDLHTVFEVPTTVTVVDGADIPNFYIETGVNVNFYGGYAENLQGGEYGLTTIYGGQIDNISVNTASTFMYDGTVGTLRNIWCAAIYGGDIDTLRVAGSSRLSGGTIGTIEFDLGYLYGQADIFDIYGYGLSLNYDSDTTGTITGWLEDGTWLGDDGLPFLILDRPDDLSLTINVHNIGPSPVPEPSTILLIGIGFTGFALRKRSKFSKISKR